MQRSDPNKRRDILAAATQLFAARPYHEVRLDDVAAAARVGKGTLYIYFSSKEELYLSLVRDGFADMVAAAEAGAGDAGADAWARLREVIRGLVRFGARYPDLYRVMRSGALTPDDPQIQATRARLSGLVTRIIREGIDRREMNDPHPDLTAQFVLAFVRGALLYPAPGQTPELLEGHVLRVLRSGVGKDGAP